MTKQRILITGNPSPFVMCALLQQHIDGEIDFAFDRLEVDVSDYDMIVGGEFCLPVLSGEQISDLRERINGDNISICPDWICDSITLLDDKPEQKLSPYKIKTIAKHNYPWYHQRSFR